VLKCVDDYNVSFARICAFAKVSSQNLIFGLHVFTIVRVIYYLNCNFLKSNCRICISQNDKYFVGSKLSWADLFVYNSIDDLFRFLPQVKEKFNNQFKELFNAIHSDQNLKKYLNERPQTLY